MEQIQGQNKQRTATRISHPLGEFVGVSVSMFPPDDSFRHIYRLRSLFLAFEYILLKQFSASWKEV